MTKRFFYKFRYNNFIKFRLGPVIISVFIIVGAIKVFPHFFRNTCIVTITNKRIVRSNNTNKYLIYSQTEDGNIRVFENADSILELKFKSDDLFWGLGIYKKYEIKAYGLNIPLLSYYQNIIRVKGI
jgi:hypothetical protein